MEPLRIPQLAISVLLILSATISCNAFTSSFIINNFKLASISGASSTPLRTRKILNVLLARGSDDTNIQTVPSTYETTLSSNKIVESSAGSRLHKVFRRRKKDVSNQTSVYKFTYDYNEMVIGSNTKQQQSSSATTAIMLVHPIGVGIGKWYYDRLLQSLKNQYGDIESRVVFIVPDLLASATASGPMDKNGELITTKLPLLNITDWSDQITHLMSEYELKSKAEGHIIGSWSIVANGGCAPIALRVAASSLLENPPFKATLTNVIISSPPRLPFFIEVSNPNPLKVHKSYSTLSGLSGKLFWWYALRKDGKFIQKFSERNLVGDPSSLGEEWTTNCLTAARLYNGQSRYSTFAFLAGNLQDGCMDSLNTLRGSHITIDFIRGSDKRRNRAKSWFWSRKKKQTAKSDDSINEEDTRERSDAPTLEEETIQQMFPRMETEEMSYLLEAVSVWHGKILMDMQPV